jgi:Cu+-exporting ATPase
MNTRHVDPVCGMSVDESTEFRAEYAGRTYYFCSDRCRAKFEGDPGRYAGRGT